MIPPTDSQAVYHVAYKCMYKKQICWAVEHKRHTRETDSYWAGSEEKETVGIELEALKRLE